MDSSPSRANLSDLYLPANAVRSRPGFSETIRRRAQYLQKQAYVFYFVFKHPRTRWYGRLVAMGAAAYVFSPVQLIPNFIPVIGCLDDVLVILLAARIIQMITPADVLAECRALADDSEARRKDEFRWAAIAPLVLAVVWFLTAIAVTAWVATYIYF
jgi:uncharacterized membrane protein YkvA (DUF1232 family)